MRATGHDSLELPPDVCNNVKVLFRGEPMIETLLPSWAADQVRTRAKRCVVLAVVLSSLAATGCNRSKPDIEICRNGLAPSETQARAKLNQALSTPRPTAPHIFGANRVYAEACLQRWSYLLGGSDQSVDAVTAAVRGACQAAVDDLAVAASGLPAGNALAARVEDAAEGIAKWAEDRSRFYIVQAKAGDCGVMPE